ncbi:MAG: NHLP family bacteriocin export ABC transporter peptidase/permease/ATPase subunit [Acidobacteria bacterium]|nr:MAG: NHLP family bacteriocin export ABC transporter peptidase/permease/ATPase subunit [Acidobacteriota bacterium]REK03193.1 MAG: NHLP family bacteriocin export ABC transporter peptidase/permease/ATPase subunit [Acidobacteriota bacterium]
MANIALLRPRHDAETVTLTGSTLIGRDEAAGVQILHGTVSRRHALLEPAGKGYSVQDLGSSNGTQVNGVRIHQVTMLGSGDVVRFGEIEFVFELVEQAPAETEAPPAEAQPSDEPRPRTPEPAAVPSVPSVPSVSSVSAESSGERAVPDPPAAVDPPPDPAPQDPPRSQVAADRQPPDAAPDPLSTRFAPSGAEPAGPPGTGGREEKPPAVSPPAPAPPARTPAARPSQESREPAARPERPATAPSTGSEGRPAEAVPAPAEGSAPRASSPAGLFKQPSKREKTAEDPFDLSLVLRLADQPAALRSKPPAPSAVRPQRKRPTPSEEGRKPRRAHRPAPAPESEAKPKARVDEDEASDLPKPPSRRVRTPTVLQMEAVECGAAALAIVLRHYKRFVALEDLRVDCGVSRDGSKASNVLKGARKYGLVAKGFKNDLKQLFDLTFPAILFWNFNHFVVLEGFKGGKVYINDPAQGPRVLDMEDLDASYSGVCLTFEPGDDFEPGGDKPGIFPALQRRLDGSRTALAFVVLAGLFLVIPGLIIPTFSRVFIDEYLIAGRAAIVQPLLLGMGLTMVLQLVLNYLQQTYLLRLETKLALVESSKFFAHILRLPVSYFSQRFAGEIGSRVMINDKVARVLSGQLATTAIDMLLLFFYAALMMIYSVSLTLVCIALALLNVVAVRLVSRRRVDASRRLAQEEGKLTGTAMGGLRMIETLKATGGEAEFFSRWAGYQAKAMQAQQDIGMLGAWVGSVPTLINSITTITILLLGGLKVMNGELTVGMLVAYQTLMASFSRPLNTFVAFGSTIQELEADMNRLDDVTRYPQDHRYRREGRSHPAAEGLLKLSGKVELKNLEFGYSPLEPALITGFDLTIQPGQRIGLVGGSGSGKSTIARLITGLYRPWSGQILYDGIPLEQLPPDLITNSIAVVDQEVFLFAGSIRDNVAMWDPSIRDVAVTGACKDAAIAEVIENRDGAYHSAVSEGGSNFSGGQRQRLEIARALVGEPTILILDEATSALDPTTETKIDESLRRRGCTCIIVAHRLSTIRDCDEILVLDRGKIVQRGTHEEMKNVKGPYQSLIDE